jgi:hypothetical protein
MFNKYSFNLYLYILGTYKTSCHNFDRISLYDPPPKYAMPDPGFWAAGAPLCYVVQKPGSASPAVSGLEVLPIL